MESGGLELQEPRERGDRVGYAQASPELGRASSLAWKGCASGKPWGFVPTWPVASDEGLHLFLDHPLPYLATKLHSSCLVFPCPELSL